MINKGSNSNSSSSSSWYEEDGKGNTSLASWEMCVIVVYPVQNSTGDGFSSLVGQFPFVYAPPMVGGGGGGDSNSDGMVAQQSWHAFPSTTFPIRGLF
ncbi:hypothetical protein M0804_012399 [Polistes exclamans]|nr:hypothetical protein M0804_012399 [Polistes exclamans]